MIVMLLELSDGVTEFNFLRLGGRTGLGVPFTEAGCTALIG